MYDHHDHAVLHWQSTQSCLASTVQETEDWRNEKLVLEQVNTVGHHLFDTQLFDSTDCRTVVGLSELRGCAHAGIYDSCAYSTTATVLQQEERKL